MGTAGDPVIAGAGLLRVDEKSKGAASGDFSASATPSTVSALAAQSIRSLAKSQR